jgi:hypothetical protein
LAERVIAISPIYGLPAKPPAKPPANGVNRTERSEAQNLRIRDSMELAERTGREWNRAPVFRKQQAVG